MMACRCRNTPSSSVVKPGLQAARSWLVLLPTLLAIIVATAGCTSTSRQYFEDFGLAGGLSIEKPSSWQAEFEERNDTIVLKSNRGFRGKDSALIVIHPYTTVPASSTLSAHMAAAIDMIGARYALDSDATTQPVAVTQYEDYETATATISIPTEAIPADSSANQVGVREPGTFQTIVLHAIRCADNLAMVYVYKSNNERLNVEAENIVKSIELACPTPP